MPNGIPRSNAVRKMGPRVPSRSVNGVTPQLRVAAAVAALAVLITSCTAATDDVSLSAAAPETSAATDASLDAGGSETASTEQIDSGATAQRSACVAADGGVPWRHEIAAEAVVLDTGTAATPRVEAIVYPHPDYAGKPWSQWGQGLITEDGRYLSAIGDHFGPDGNSFLYSYDPADRTLTQIADVLDLVDHEEGDFGFGKIHAQMVAGPCGEVLLTTYWGTRRDLTYSDTYRGDYLISIDPSRETIIPQGVLVEAHGVPSLAGWQAGGLLYAEAADPFGQKEGQFVVYDLDGSSVLFTDDGLLNGFRSMAVDADGRAYYSTGSGVLTVYDPDTNTASEFPASIPGESLRAATIPDEAGIIYGVTRSPERFFALDPAGVVTDLGPATDYTTSIALSADGSSVFYVPAAHGGAWKLGAPLLVTDTATGAQETVVELGPIVEEGLGLRLGGTYNLVVDPDGSRLYIGMNASPLDDDSGFGEVVLLIVTLP